MKIYDEIISEIVLELQHIEKDVASAMQSADGAKDEARHWHLKRARVLAYPRVGLRSAIRIIEGIRDGQ